MLLIFFNKLGQSLLFEEGFSDVILHHLHSHSLCSWIHDRTTLPLPYTKITPNRDESRVNMDKTKCCQKKYHIIHGSENKYIYSGNTCKKRYIRKHMHTEYIMNNKRCLAESRDPWIMKKKTLSDSNRPTNFSLTMRLLNVLWDERRIERWKSPRTHAGITWSLGLVWQFGLSMTHIWFIGLVHAEQL
jgi:hypothetical protein